ncbi:sigma-70 family RNA polymerase sigma factor [Kineococcus sp. DHX-1]|uniref:sigma-70 family RNA polymerase sigma factor n=1 Tax=Kineococcus sp. DHX-1 TaxID=3349638 RepID=UPI0036D25E60
MGRRQGRRGGSTVQDDASRADGLRDEADVARAYAAHGAELYRFALRGLGDAAAAQDVVQETFLRAWRAADRYDPALASLRVWLFAIARNTLLDHVRAAGARPWQGALVADVTDLSDGTPGAVGGDPGEDVLRGWVVEEALRRLSPEHRTAVVETYLRDRPPAEVAAELGVPVGTVRSRVFYGLKALRVAMDEMGVEP